MNNRLTNLGFTQQYIERAKCFNQLFIGRVIAQYNNLYKVATETSEVMAEVSGKLRYSASSAVEFPAVGDFVMLDRQEDDTGNAIIHKVLERKSAFVRKAAGTGNEVQIVAANIDIVFICMALNRDYNLRRLERYISIAWDSGAMPVVVLTKADLCENVSAILSEVYAVAIGVDVVVTSGLDSNGFEPVLDYIKPGKTIAFIGSSGVGKSTLINRLIGNDEIATNATRADDKGRHTTTRRDLIALSQGGAVIDTPGMREVGIENADVGATFVDIDDLAAQCKFHDCTHNTEPGCAVKDAIKKGILTAERLESYNKLKKEAKYEGLNFRQIEHEKVNTMFSEFGGMKNARDYLKSRSKKR